jgi:hypothetical protein
MLALRSGVTVIYKRQESLVNAWSSLSSGWKVAAIALPWRTTTGSFPSVARTSTWGPSCSILGRG